MFSKIIDKLRADVHGKEIAYGTTLMQMVSAKFVTVDGVEHNTGHQWKWCKKDDYRCSVGEVIMVGIKQCGYIADEDDVMYPLNNVVSIKWNIDKELIVINNTDKFHSWFTYEELEKVGIIK